MYEEVIMNVQLKRGTLDILVLSVISKGETYGYKIVKDLEDFYPISESTLYPILKRLVESNSVKVRDESINGRLRKMYSITGIGYEKILKFLEDFQEILMVYGYIKMETRNEHK